MWMKRRCHRDRSSWCAGIYRVSRAVRKYERQSSPSEPKMEGKREGVNLKGYSGG